MSRASWIWGVFTAASAAAALVSTTVAIAPAQAQEKASTPPEGTVKAPVKKSVTLIDGVPMEPLEAPFRDGESLTFSATWMNISVGDATMTVDTDGDYEGKPAIHLKAQASSGRAFSLFFSIKDAGESWVHPTGLYSLGFVSDQKEGNIEDYQKWVMDYENNVAIRHRARRKDGGEVKNSTKDYALTTTHVQDAFSMLYYYRAFPLKVGTKLESDVFVSRKVWKLTVDVVGQETVKVPAGKFDCLKVRPEVSLNGKKQEKGQMTIWVTNDDRKIPVKIQSEIPLGKINAVLSKMKEGKKKEAL